VAETTRFLQNSSVYSGLANSRDFAVKDRINFMCVLIDDIRIHLDNTIEVWCAAINPDSCGPGVAAGCAWKLLSNITTAIS